MPRYSNLLITGGSGFLGWNLARYAAEYYDISFTYHQHPIKIKGCQEYPVNLQNPQEIEELVEEIHPDVLIHTAALADVDFCENRRSIAYEINVAATEAWVRCAEEIGCRFIYISTDLVFDGQTGLYQETDQPHPVNYYGETKLLGEHAVSAGSTNYLILRMALMYGTGNGINGSFTDWMREGLQREKPVTLYTDQYRTPLFVGEGVRAIMELIEQPMSNEMYHIAGRERINRYEFGRIFAQTFGYDARWLKPVQMQDVQSPIPRGKDCSLATDKVQKVLSFPLSDAVTGLQQMKSTWAKR